MDILSLFRLSSLLFVDFIVLFLCLVKTISLLVADIFSIAIAYSLISLYD